MVTTLPELTTDRLLLRPFSPADAPRVQQLAGVPEIASTTLNIPHPYADGMAEAWIETHASSAALGRSYTFAVVEKASGLLVGAMTIGGPGSHKSAELGYWLGKPFWGKGYATEAALRVVQFGFEELGLNRIFARHITRNPASGKVMQKIGMVYEGTLRQEVIKWDQYEDVACYSILRRDWR